MNGDAPTTEPYWLPPGLKLAGWPPELRREIRDLMSEVYEELVRDAPSALERVTAITTVHMLFLEILEQLAHRAALENTFRPQANPLSFETAGADYKPPPNIYDRMMKIAHAKLQASQLLLRLKEFEERRKPQGPPRR